MLAEFDLDLGAGIGHQHDLALGAERRLQDRAERGHHDVARRQADPDAHPGRQIGGRESLPAHQPGEIAGTKKDERFGFHVLAAFHVRVPRVGQSIAARPRSALVEQDWVVWDHPTRKPCSRFERAEPDSRLGSLRSEPIRL